MKRLCAYLGAALLLLTLTAGCSRPPEAAEDGRLRVVATVFPAYDFARSAGGDLAEVELLLPPGAESHSYEPTPADILAVQECDLFLYLGGRVRHLGGHHPGVRGAKGPRPADGGLRAPAGGGDGGGHGDL